MTRLSAERMALPPAGHTWRGQQCLSSLPVPRPDPESPAREGPCEHRRRPGRGLRGAPSARLHAESSRPPCPGLGRRGPRGGSAATNVTFLAVSQSRGEMNPGVIFPPALCINRVGFMRNREGSVVSDGPSGSNGATPPGTWCRFESCPRRRQGPGRQVLAPPSAGMAPAHRTSFPRSPGSEPRRHRWVDVAARVMPRVEPSPRQRHGSRKGTRSRVNDSAGGAKPSLAAASGREIHCGRP